MPGSTPRYLDSTLITIWFHFSAINTRQNLFSCLKTQYAIDYSKLDYLSLVDNLSNYDFDEILSCHDVEDIWNQLSTIIKETIKQCAPTVKLRARKNYPMWYDSTTRHLINRVRSARKKARLYQTPNNINKLERADQELSSHMFVTKANYETRLVTKFASSNIYKYLRSTSRTDGAMHDESTLVTSDLDKATLFNNFFVSVHSKTVPVQLPLNQPSSVGNDMDVTESDVLAALSRLDPSKATGLDGIGQGSLFTMSLKSSRIPSEWKKHRIVPIFKSGDKTSVRNYRPISLLCTISF